MAARSCLQMTEIFYFDRRKGFNFSIACGFKFFVNGVSKVNF